MSNETNSDNENTKAIRKYFNFLVTWSGKSIKFLVTWGGKFINFLVTWGSKFINFWVIWFFNEVKKLIFPWLIKPILVFIFALLVIELLMPKMLDKTSSNLQDLEISTTGVSMKFSSEGKLKTLKIINVPAYQLGVFSGVKLEKNKTIKIQATGLVTTGLVKNGVTFSPKTPETSDKNATSELWLEAFQELKLNTDFQVGWRDPKGDLIFFANPKNEKPEVICLDKVAKERKLEKNLKYGYLLGVIVSLDSTTDEQETYQIQNQNTQGILDKDNLVLIDKKRQKVGTIKGIIPIGQQAEIKLNDYAKESEFREDYIYFIVNDSLLEYKEAFTNIENKLLKEQDCFDKIVGKNENSWKSQIWNYQKQLYEELEKSSTNNPSSLWFLNNQGSFTVTIIETKQ